MCRQFICVIRDEARLFVVTGAPVQPHSSVGLSGLGARYRWILIPELIHKHVGLPVNACSPREFCSFFDVPDPSAPQDSHTCSVRALVCMCRHMHSIQIVLYIPASIALFSLRLSDRAHKAHSVPAVALLYTFQCLPSHVPYVLTEEDEEDDINATPPAMPEFIPSSDGLTHELPDTVMVQLRLHKVNGRYQALYVTHIALSWPSINVYRLVCALSAIACMCPSCMCLLYSSAPYTYTYIYTPSHTCI